MHAGLRAAGSWVSASALLRPRRPSFISSPFPTPPHHQVRALPVHVYEGWIGSLRLSRGGAFIPRENTIYQYQLDKSSIVDGVDLRYFWLGRRLVPNQILPPILGISELGTTTLWTLRQLLREIDTLVLFSARNPRHQLL